MVGDVAKLDMLNGYVYPVVGDVAKLDICSMAMCIQWLVMWQSWIYTSMLFVAYSFSWDSKQYTYDLHDISIYVGLHQVLTDHVIPGFINCS